MSGEQDLNAAEPAAAAKRRPQTWAARVSNVLLTLLLVLSVLLVAPHLLQWWRLQKMPDPAVLRRDHLDFAAPGIAHELQFGSQPFRLTRQTVAGDAATAAERLADAVWNHRTAARPTTPVGQAESRLLAQLVNLAPARSDGDRRLFLATRPIPLAAVVAGNGPAGADAKNRLVVWGSAQKQVGNQWIIYVWRAEAPLELLVPLPADAERTLTMGLGSGGGPRMTGFVARADFAGSGGDLVKAWAAAFERWAAEQRWTGQGSWQHAAKAEPVEPPKPGAGQPAAVAWAGQFRAADGRRQVTIRIEWKGNGRPTGLITEQFAPAATAGEEDR